MKRFIVLAMVCVIGIVAAGCAQMRWQGEGAMKAGGGPVMDPPTLQCLGAYWIVPDAVDSDEKPAAVDSEYRKVGSTEWMAGAPFIRCKKGPFIGERGQPKEQLVKVPAGSRMFAGSLLLLEPDTAYEWKLTLRKGDGTSVERILKGRTIGEPVVSATAPRRHVIIDVLGKGGGDGSAANPFRGLEAADKAARPGDVMVVHAGIYPAIVLHSSGKPGKPIVWQGARDGETIIDGKDMKEVPLHAKDPNNPRVNAIDAQNLHDVWFEYLTACNGRVGFAIHESADIVIRRCYIHHVVEGIYCTINKDAKVKGFFISDNLLEGMYKWPVTKEEWHELPETRGIWIVGRGHVACYNRIRHWKDGMDTEDSIETVAVDFHNNDVSESFDDGCEMDGSDRNCRNFNNRYCNTLTGVSLQPVYGGPIYVFRNVSYNAVGEPFKLHNDPAGGVLFHNTFVKFGQPVGVSSGGAVHNCWERNNLFVGTEGRAFNYDVAKGMIDCDFDYDGVAGWSGPVFMKWNKVMYQTPEEVREKSPAEKHCIVLEAAGLFASGLKAPESNQTVYDRTKMDFRLAADSAARGKGEALPWANGGKIDAADLGAIPFGGVAPFYGIRPEGGK